MVADTRKALRAGAVQALSLPEPVLVYVDRHGQPARVTLRGRRHAIAQVRDRWRIDDEWWRDRPIARMYHEVILEDGATLTLFQDLDTQRWYVQTGV